MRPEFDSHQLNERGQRKLGDIRKTFDECLGRLVLFCGEGRHFSVAKTHLETACFFAIKAMANDPANHHAKSFPDSTL